jgi:hypothetical protein
MDTLPTVLQLRVFFALGAIPDMAQRVSTRPH